MLAYLYVVLHNQHELEVIAVQDLELPDVPVHVVAASIRMVVCGAEDSSLAGDLEAQSWRAPPSRIWSSPTRLFRMRRMVTSRSIWQRTGYLRTIQKVPPMV